MFSLRHKKHLLGGVSRSLFLSNSHSRQVEGTRTNFPPRERDFEI